MAKVGVGNEPLLERLIFGAEGTNYRVVVVDAAGNIVAALKAGSTVEVTQDTAADLKATVSLADDQNVQARAYGYFNAAWQRQPLLIGYGGVVNEQVVNLSSPAGTTILDGTVVPANRVYVIEGAAGLDVNTATTAIELGVISGGVYTPFTRGVGVAANNWHTWNGRLTLAPGDNLRCVLVGTVLNDDTYLRYHGYFFNTNL
jgi:hypothetical protein